MDRRYSLILDGRRVDLPASVQDDAEAERYARLAVLARYGCSARLGPLTWVKISLGRERHVYRARPSGSEYVGRIECLEIELAEVYAKKTP